MFFFLSQIIKDRVHLGIQLTRLEIEDIHFTGNCLGKSHFTTNIVENVLLLIIDVKLHTLLKQNSLLQER